MTIDRSIEAVYLRRIGIDEELFDVVSGFEALSEKQRPPAV